MDERVLDTQMRDKTGKEAAHKIRQQGFIPAVLYGHRGNKNLTVSAIEFEKIFEEIGEHSILTVNIDGKKKAEVIVKDFQIDPVKKNVIHVDFLEFEKGKLLRTEIPIKITGTSKGVKKGGILEAFIRDIEIECLPKDIPDSIAVDVENLDIGDSLHIKALVVDEKIKILSNPEQVVITIGTPTKIEVPIEEVEAVPVEGEVPEEEEIPRAPIPESKSESE